MLPEHSTELAKRVAPHRLILKWLPRPAAELYIDRHFPELEGNEREYALSFASQSIPPKGPQTHNDALFCAAMFLAGVSLGDLSKLFGIAKPTVHQKIGRKLNHIERQQRDSLQVLDLEVLALCKEIFNDALQAAPNCFDGIYPLTIGRGLLSAANAKVAEDRGDDPIPQRPRRYSNMNISDKSGRDQAKEIVEMATEMRTAEEAIETLEEVEQLKPQAPNVVRPDEQEFLDSL